MLPMTTAAHKPQETIEELVERVWATQVMSPEDAQRILRSARDREFYLDQKTLVDQAIAVKLAGM